MLAFWPEILMPVLSALQPRDIVEIGSESGKVTRLLLELAGGYGGRVVAIDPSPTFDAEAWQVEFGPRFRLHRRRSLEVLPELDAFDTVLIDGDHNWYTVWSELLLLERRAHELRRRMPLVFLHDIAWPYGRRDLYYAPETIPEAHRQPYARRGIHFESSELVERGGINSHLYNAVREGGPRNGVLTGVEDYLAATGEALRFVRIPAVFGLGILVPSWLKDEHPAVASFCELWADPRLERFVSRLELARIGASMGSLGSASRR